VPAVSVMNIDGQLAAALAVAMRRDVPIAYSPPSRGVTGRAAAGPASAMLRATARPVD
jgi:hypothetical protein